MSKNNVGYDKNPFNNHYSQVNGTNYMKKSSNSYFERVDNYQQQCPIVNGNQNSLNDKMQNLYINSNYPQQQYPTIYQNYQNQQSHYQQQQLQPQTATIQTLPENYYQSNVNVVQDGFNKMWGSDDIDLLQNVNIWPKEKPVPLDVNLHPVFPNSSQCDPEIFRCSFRQIPDTKSLLEKSRLPLGLTIHPFRDINNLSLIQTNKIIRCQSCRAYINPFVGLGESKRWSCNMCNRSNELSDEFYFDPTTQSYGDPSKRPEIRNCTIEYIAPADYMLRPPQPAVYLFVLDVSCLAVKSGYLKNFCNILIEELDHMPGDSRTMVSFIAFDTNLYFYSISDNLSRPHEMIICDIEDTMIPFSETLLINLKENRRSIIDFLKYLPSRFACSFDTDCALGAALTAGYKLMSRTGGRITVFLTCLPTKEPGKLEPREDPTKRTANDVLYLKPATDFYKRIALDCNEKQIAVDLFILNSQYVDLATLSSVSKYSGGCISHYPQYKTNNFDIVRRFDEGFRRYLRRKIGFEAVMRIRCTRGISIHSFHGHCFVRSADLLVLPNVNPDAAIGVHLHIDENLTDMRFVSFQAALLYTSSLGERRIRVHTICFPLTSNLRDLYQSADQLVILSLFAKMGVNLALESSLSDTKEALINHVIFLLTAYKNFSNYSGHGLLIPKTLKLLPILVFALLKYTCFRSGKSIRIDDRVSAMCNLKTFPLSYIIQSIYPDLYSLNDLIKINENNNEINLNLSLLPLNSKNLTTTEIYLLDNVDTIIIFCGSNAPYEMVEKFFGNYFESDEHEVIELPLIQTYENQLLHRFIEMLNIHKPYNATIMIARNNNYAVRHFIESFVEDKSECLMSYFEFLQHLKDNLK